MLTYLFIGAVWSMWLEYYTTRNLEGLYGSSWVLGERIFHIAVWPYSFLVFLFALIKEFISRIK
jgi:hypothetical protein